MFVLLGSAHSASALANPASVKCIEDGGTSLPVNTLSGTYSNCTFPDGSVCEEWAYFNGTCTPKKVDSMSELSEACVAAFDGCNSCSRTSGGQWACTRMACMNQPTTPAAYCKKFQTTNPDPVMCPAIYAPVCGQKMVSCSGPDGRLPCVGDVPQYKKYSNSCVMGADGATEVSDNVCKDLPNITKPPFCNASYIKLVRGSKGDYVRGLQEYLRDQGYNPGTIDGVFGRQVVAAVKEFQKNHGLNSDGIFGKGSKAKVCAMF